MKDAKYIKVFEDTLKLAMIAHKPGYLMHILEVAMALETFREKALGIAHDLIEDTDVTINVLRVIGFDDTMIYIIGCLTRDPSETYQGYLERIMTNPIAVRVKIADLESNMGPGRNYGKPALTGIHATARLLKYRKAWYRLKKHQRTTVE